MVFEDLHWIDPSSRDLLDRTIERVPRLPVLLVITFRPDFNAPWTGLSQVTAMTLARLDRRAGIAMVADIAGAEALAGEVVTAAIAKAAFYPTLAITEELQQQVQNFDGFCGVARMHDNGSRNNGSRSG
jgi:predicted ATPase